MDIIVMTVLNDAPAYGYEIMATVHREFGVLLSPGTLYPLLHWLEEKELIESSQNGGRIVYSASLRGKKRFKEALDAFSFAIDKMSAFVKEREKEIVLQV